MKRNPSIKIPRATLAERVAHAKAEILADVASGKVPATARDFSELHDYVDANGYGGWFIEGGDEGKKWGYRSYADVKMANAVGDAIDAWIKGGNLSVKSNPSPFRVGARVQDEYGNVGTVEAVPRSRGGAYHVRMDPTGSTGVRSFANVALLLRSELRGAARRNPVRQGGHYVASAATSDRNAAYKREEDRHAAAYRAHRLVVDPNNPPASPSAEWTAHANAYRLHLHAARLYAQRTLQAGKEAAKIGREADAWSAKAGARVNPRRRNPDAYWKSPPPDAHPAYKGHESTDYDWWVTHYAPAAVRAEIHAERRAKEDAAYALKYPPPTAAELAQMRRDEADYGRKLRAGLQREDAAWRAPTVKAPGRKRNPAPRVKVGDRVTSRTIGGTTIQGHNGGTSVSYTKQTPRLVEGILIWRERPTASVQTDDGKYVLVDDRYVRPAAKRNPAPYDVAAIKRTARAAGHPVYSVKNGTGSLRGLVSVYFDEPLPGPEAMSRASEWMRATYPDVPFSGLKPQQFCDYWLRYSAAERKAKDARPTWSVRGNPRGEARVLRRESQERPGVVLSLSSDGRDIVDENGTRYGLDGKPLYDGSFHVEKPANRPPKRNPRDASWLRWFATLDAEGAIEALDPYGNRDPEDVLREARRILAGAKRNPASSFTRTAAWKTATSAGQGVRVEKPTARTTILHGNGGKAVRIVCDASGDYYAQLAQNARADGTGDVIRTYTGATLKAATAWAKKHLSR